MNFSPLSCTIISICLSAYDIEVLQKKKTGGNFYVFVSRASGEVRAILEAGWDAPIERERQALFYIFAG